MFFLSIYSAIHIKLVSERDLEVSLLLVHWLELITCGIFIPLVISSYSSSSSTLCIWALMTMISSRIITLNMHQILEL